MTWIANYIRGCTICQQNKIITHQKKTPLYGITVPQDAQPFQQIAMDLIMGLPSRNGKDAILTIVDHSCSRAVVFLPCLTNITGPGIAQLYLEHVYRWFGLPKKMISDWDPQFTSHFSKALLSKLGIAQNLSTMFHPQTDGLSERKNQWIEQYLRLVMSLSPEHWTQWLDIASAVHNNRKNATTELSPNQILIGYETILAPSEMPPSNNQMVEDQIKNMMEHWAQAIDAINKAAKGTRSIPEQYSIRDQVWLEGKHLKFPHQKIKLNPKRYGPFKIIKAISSVAYQLQLPPSWKIHPVFHASLLSPYSKTPSHGPNFSWPPPDLIDGETEYKVELIRSHQCHGQSRMLQYLIKWKGYPESNNTWENTNQIHAPNLIKLYHWNNPLQRIKGQLLSLQSLHSPTWQSSTFPLLHSLPTLSSPQTTKIPLNSLNPSFISPHTQPISSTSSTLIGNETMPPKPTHLNTNSSAKRCIAATTLRMAWSHPLLYPASGKHHLSFHTFSHLNNFLLRCNKIKDFMTAFPVLFLLISCRIYLKKFYVLYDKTCNK